MCSSSIAADIWTRTRAVPSGTTGKPKPVTKTPSSSSRRENSIANAVSPTMIGTIAASPSSGLKPISRSRSRNCRGLARAASRRAPARGAARAPPRAPSTRPSAAARSRRAAAASAGRGCRRPPRSPPRSRRPRRRAPCRACEVITSTSPSSPKCSATPRPVSPDHARAVRVVDDERRVVLADELDDLGQLREVALHREDAVRDHERALPGSSDSSCCAQRRPCRSACRPPCARASRAGRRR